MIKINLKNVTKIQVVKKYVSPFYTWVEPKEITKRIFFFWTNTIKKPAGFLRTSVLVLWPDSYDEKIYSVEEISNDTDYTVEDKKVFYKPRIRFYFIAGDPVTKKFETPEEMEIFLEENKILFSQHTHITIE